jgi:hypothetical protein
MSHDSTALSPDEKTIRSFLSTVLNAFDEVDFLRRHTEVLSNENLDKAGYITELEADNRALTTSRDSYRLDLEAEQAETANLRVEIAQLRAALEAEQILAGQHWSNLQTVTADRNQLEIVLADTTFTLTSTTTKLAEAETTLGKFRDILGLPVPTPEVNEHSPVPLEVPAIHDTSPEPKTPAERPLTEQVSLRPDEPIVVALAETMDLPTPTRGSERRIIEGNDWF